MYPTGVSGRHLGGGTGGGVTAMRAHPPVRSATHPHLSPPVRHHRNHPHHHHNTHITPGGAGRRGGCPSPRHGIHSPPGGMPSPPRAGLPSPASTGGGGGAGGVTVRAAGDVPASITVGPYLFDLALGLHMSDTRAPADVIQARLCGGTLVVEGETSPRWLAYIQAARDRHEQTLEAFRDPRGFIFYRSVRPLRAGEELLVWYGDELARECGIPVLTPTHIRGDQQYVCNTCSKSYKHPNCLKAHMRFHCSAPTRLDLLVSARSTDPWLQLTPSPPRHSLDVLRSPERPSISPPSTTSCPSGPVNLKIGEGSAFKPPKREPETMRQSPDSTRDLPDTMQERKTEACIKEEIPTTTTEKRFEVPSPSKAVSLKDVASKFPARTGMSASVPQPFHIFNHIHPPHFPMPMDNHTALKYYYAPYYNKVHGNGTSQLCYSRMLKQSAFPNGYLHGPNPYFPFAGQKIHSTPNRDNTNMGEAVKTSPHHNMEASPDSACLPFAFPLPSEKAGEPLDLLPRSLYMHKSRKGHLCIYCGKLYSRKYGLKIHLRTHTGYKPLKCKVCLRPFGDPSNLNKHIRLHAEGDTPYRCDYCGKVLVRRRDLERHIKSRHPNEAAKLGAADSEVSSSGKQSDLDGSASPELEHNALSSGESVGSPTSFSDSKDYIDVDDDMDEDDERDEEDDDDDEDIDVTEIEVVA